MLAQRSSRSPRTTAAPLVLTDTKLPFDERETHGYRQFAEACGYQLSNYEVVRHLPLPVPDDRIQGWIDEAAARHEGYTIETFVDDGPRRPRRVALRAARPARGRRAHRCRRLRRGGHDARAVRRERRHGEGDGPGPLRDARAHARPAGRRAVDPRRAPVVGSTTSSSGARSSTASTAGTRWASRRRP